MFYCVIRYELGRQPANTKLSSNKTVRRIRVRGGNVKWRALRLDTGNYSWGSEAVTHKTRILDVVYNASNNELVRTQTLVKSAIVQVDAAPFKQWYLQHYGVDIGRKKKATAKKETTEVIYEFETLFAFLFLFLIFLIVFIFVSECCLWF
jgi:small subunit ribosomal protein S8e